MVSSNNLDRANLARKSIKALRILLLVSAAPICLSGCAQESNEMQLRNWQELRKEAVVKYGQARDHGALGLLLKALQVAQSMGPYAITRPVSLNELSQIILVSGEKIPIQDYIDQTLQQTDYWLESPSSNPERGVSFTELSEALLNYATLCRKLGDNAQAQKLDERSLFICQTEATTATASAPDLILGYRWGRAVYAVGDDYLRQNKAKEGRKALQKATESPLTTAVPQPIAEKILLVYGKLTAAANRKVEKSALAGELGLSGNGEENAPLSQWSKYLRMGKTFLYDRNDSTSAESMLLKAADQAKKTSDPEIPAGQSLYHLGVAYLQDKKYAQAEAALLESAKFLENNPSGAEDLQSTLGSLVALYRKQKNPDKAEQFATRRLTVIKSFYGEDSVEAGLALTQVADILRMKKDFAQAEVKGQEAVHMVEQKVEDDDARLGLAKTMLASTYLADKKYALARPILADAMKIWDTRRAQNPAAAGFADGLYQQLRKEDPQNAGVP